MSDDDLEKMGRLMLGYLPSAYSEDAESRAFLEKFLGVFGCEIIASEDLIAQMPRYFDPRALSDEEAEFLSWLAGWLSLDLFDQYAGKNPDYLLKATEFYKKKGTAAGLISLLEFFTDRQVLIKEGGSLIFRSYSMDLMDEFHPMSLTFDSNDWDMRAKMGSANDVLHYIYPGRGGGQGGSSSTISIYIRMNPGEVLDVGERDRLSKLIEPFLPAMIEAEIKELEYYG